MLSWFRSVYSWFFSRKAVDVLKEAVKIADVARPIVEDIERSLKPHIKEIAGGGSTTSRFSAVDTFLKSYVDDTRDSYTVALSLSALPTNDLLSGVAEFVVHRLMPEKARPFIRLAIELAYIVMKLSMKREQKNDGSVAS